MAITNINDLALLDPDSVTTKDVEEAWAVFYEAQFELFSYLQNECEELFGLHRYKPIEISQRRGVQPKTHTAPKYVNWVGMLPKNLDFEALEKHIQNVEELYVIARIVADKRGREIEIDRDSIVWRNKPRIVRNCSQITVSKNQAWSSVKIDQTDQIEFIMDNENLKESEQHFTVNYVRSEPRFPDEPFLCEETGEPNEIHFLTIPAHEILEKMAEKLGLSKDELYLRRMKKTGLAFKATFQSSFSGSWREGLGFVLLPHHADVDKGGEKTQVYEAVPRKRRKADPETDVSVSSVFPALRLNRNSDLRCKKTS